MLVGLGRQARGPRLHLQEVTRVEAMAETKGGRKSIGIRQEKCVTV